ncbi:hypothetical protein FOL46_002997 [Perkinsus olseni]|uniref:Uncharacterized protein n=1 Tax=Perkinsus olseni TaxID=32597 RepID=A0A7J6M4X1_PEROL|nr:hypothetical protein FOL46_002997 [Perkinsus olseni]
MNRLEEEKILLERRSRDVEAQWKAGDVSDQASESSAIGCGNMSLFAGDSSTAASVCGDAEAMERSFRIEKECEELRTTTSYLKQRLKLLEGSESSKEHTTEDEAQLVGFLRRLRADGFEYSRMLLLLFWKIVGSAIRARKESGLATAEAATARDRLQEVEAAKNELARTHAREIDTLKKRHRRELRRISEEMMTNNSEAELRREIAEMAVRGRDAEIARLRNDMARQWKRCWATDTERFESLWDDAQALRIQNEVLVIRDRLWKDLVKETSSDQKNEHRVKQLWAKLSAADRRISDASATLEQKQLLQKVVDDRVRVYETRIAELERAQLGDELNPQAVAELQERVVKVESAKSKLERLNGSLEVELQSKTEELSRIQQEKEHATTAMREALEAADQERARLRTELDIYHEQLCANDALRELLVMAKPIRIPSMLPPLLIAACLVILAGSRRFGSPVVDVDEGPPEYRVHTSSEDPEAPPPQMDVEPMWDGDRPILHGRAWPDEAVVRAPGTKLAARHGEFTSGVDNDAIKEVWEKYPIAVGNRATYSESNPVQAVTLGMVADLADPLNEVARLPDLPDRPADDSDVVRHEIMSSKSIKEMKNFAMSPQPTDIPDNQPPLPRMRGFTSFRAVGVGEEPARSVSPEERAERLQQHRLAGQSRFNEDFDIDKLAHHALHPYATR